MASTVTKEYCIFGFVAYKRKVEAGDELLFEGELSHYHNTRKIPGSNFGTVSYVGDDYLHYKRGPQTGYLGPDHKAEWPKVITRVPGIALRIRFRLAN